MEARDLLRQSEPETDNELAIDQTRNLATQIQNAVGDPRMHTSIPTRVARAIVDRQISASELAEILDIVADQRRKGRLRSPGAYFVTSIKRVFQRNEVPW